MTKTILKTTSGLRPDICQTYAFHDQPWFGKTDPISAKTNYLCHRCVRVGPDFYVLNGHGHWQKMPDRPGAYAVLTQQHAGKTVSFMSHTLFITTDDIKNFLTTQVAIFEGVTYAPGFGPFVIFNREMRLNTYVDFRMAGDTDDIPECAEWLKVIRNALCAAPDELDLAAMTEEISSDRKTPFRWVMHWLAARYQSPGYSTGTNLWLIGDIGGVGKGTLLTVMRELLGPTVGKVNQLDLSKGWTDSLYGRELLEWDEFKDGAGWHSFNRLIKTWTGNDTIMPNTRNRGAMLQPAVAMHIFTTNDLIPALVEQHDRRNTMIGTTKDKSWVDRAAALRDLTDGTFKNPRLTSGFAALLNMIEIDHAFIRKPLETETRLELKSMSEDSLVQWANSGALEDYAKPGKGWYVDGWKNLHSDYCLWNREATHTRSHDLKTFVRLMREKGYAKETKAKVRGGDGIRRSVHRVVLIPPGLDEEDHEANGMLVPVTFNAVETRA